jgi:ribose/xylose/arabinose/galactoside ABC-type transport system permease subunit
MDAINKKDLNFFSLIKSSLKKIDFEKYGIYIALVVLCIIFSILSPVFLTSINILNVLRQISINGIISLGMTIIIIGGGIDLSVGSTFALTGVLTATIAKMPPTPLTVIGAIVVPLFVGALCGCLNGFLVAKGNIAPFIVTLGTMYGFRGITYIYTKAQPVANLSLWYTSIGSGYLGPIPYPVIILLILFVLMWILMAKTRYGRYVYAVGGNREAAKSSGINDKLVIFITYVIQGTLVGIAAIILTSRLNAAQATAGFGYELNAIAAALVGGASFVGGVGTIPGSIVGALVIGVLLNGLNLLDVGSYYQQLAIGTIIIAAVWWGTKLQERRLSRGYI